MLRTVLLSSTAPAQSPSWVAPPAGMWLYVCLQLAAVSPQLKAARVLQYAEDARYLETLQKVGPGPARPALRQRWSPWQLRSITCRANRPQALDAVRLLHKARYVHAAAADLAPSLGPLQEPLLSALGSALISADTSRVQAAFGAMQALWWLLPSAAAAPSPSPFQSMGGSSATLAAPSVSGSARSSRRVTAESALSAISRTGSASSRRGSAPGLEPSVDLPQRCLGMLLEGLQRLLTPLVQVRVAPR